MLIVATAIHGYHIEASDGRLGSVKDFLFDDRSWRCRWIVVDTGGWLYARCVLLHPSAFHSVDHDAKLLRIDLTRTQVKDSPTIDEHQPITRETERSQFDYYSWDPFWGDGLIGTMPGGSPAGAAAMIPADGTRQPDSVSTSDGPDPHLRSIADVTNYQVEAEDGTLGHVDNLLVDDKTFTIPSLILRTSDWWGGKTVLIPVQAVIEFKAHSRTVELDVTRDQIKASPIWDPAALVEAEVADGMVEHHNWPGSRSA